MIQSEKWFIDRIGKRIYRDKTSCKCETCNDVFENGMIILDENHARYIYAVQCDFASDGEILNYRDNK